MATATDKARLQADIGATGTTFTDDELEDIFAVAESAYSDADVVYAYARVIALRRMIAATIPLVAKYKAGESTEDRTPVLQGLQSLLKYYEGELAEAERAAGSGTIRWGRLTRANPRRDREWPET